MINDEVWLRHGVQGFSDTARFAVIHLHTPPGEPLTLRLGLVAEEEHRYTLHVGDTFPVRDETWAFDRVDHLESEQWVVVLRKVT
ncbi:DUF6406 domain-containing protein [Streptomyces sp. NPDC050848]|uniref:DUF6406 domain-containing protein n=1 Tax=Streptomyces sp. NPDC050848 TaxID=3155791 RepID=UPI0033E88B33